MTDQKTFKLTLTGSKETRVMLSAVRTHLKFKYRESATMTEASDFGGRFNPIAEVIMTSTPEVKDESVKWMQGYAQKRRLSLHVVEEKPAAHPALPGHTPKLTPPAEL